MKSSAAARPPRLTALFGVDVRSLALLRVGVGALLLIDLLQRARWIPENYSERGLVPEAVLASLGGAPFPSIHLLSGSAASQQALFALAALFAVMLLVGWRTRLACVASWYLLVSLHVRNPMICDAGDSLLAQLLFWSMFLPLGATFSLDARRRAWAGPTVVLSPASAALLLQFAIVYLSAGLAKSGPEWRSDGTAVAYVMNHGYWSTSLGQWLRSYPDFMRVLTFATLVFEVAAPLLLFSPVSTGLLRCVMIPAFWIFQHSLRITIQLGIFPWICSVAILPFLPSAAWNRLEPRLRSVPGLRALVASPGVEGVGTAVHSPLWRLANGALLAFVVFVFYTSLAAWDARLVPAPLRPLVTVPRLSQFWGVYSPRPRLVDFEFSRKGTLASGAPLDLDVPVRGARWARVSEIHDDYRFKMYVQEVLDLGVEPVRQRYGRWLCREWNAAAGDDERLEAVQLLFHSQKIVPEGGRGPQQTRLVVDQPCRRSQRKRPKSGARFSANARCPSSASPECEKASSPAKASLPWPKT